MANQIPKVSIGLPVYNGERYLPAALDSLLEQTFTDFEIIISDNASTDRTEQICREYASRDPRIRYDRQEKNRGLAWNFTHTLDLARGEFFRWHAHDDLCSPEHLQTCLEAFDRNPQAVLAYPRVGVIDCNGEPLPHDPAAWRPSSVSKKITASDDRDPRGLDSSQPSQRFYGVLMKTIWCLEPYGLARTSIIRTTGKLRSYCAAEKVFIAEMALRGPLVEVPTTSFFVRRHTDQYTMAGSASAQRQLVKARRFNLRLPIPRQLRSTWGYFLLIPAAPINFRQRLRCLAVLVRYIFQIGKWKRIAINTLRGTGITDGYLHVPPTKPAAPSAALQESLPVTLTPCESNSIGA